ncbi:hypothetical protein [Streptomyces canus]|uniref:hypothetical protein n=1 Tax=Streptomyces canus TaxID=58343 RepID=UPI0036E862F6
MALSGLTGPTVSAPVRVCGPVRGSVSGYLSRQFPFGGMGDRPPQTIGPGGVRRTDHAERMTVESHEGPHLPPRFGQQRTGREPEVARPGQVDIDHSDRDKSGGWGGAHGD